jgi:hypothetical protein
MSVKGLREVHCKVIADTDRDGARSEAKRLEAHKGKAWHPDLNQLVEIVYQRRWFHYLPEDVDVLTIVGVHLATNTVLAIPPQAAPDIGAAIKAKAASKPSRRATQPITERALGKSRRKRATTSWVTQSGMKT